MWVKPFFGLGGVKLFKLALTLFILHTFFELNNFVFVMFNKFLVLLFSNVISLAMAQIKRGILGGIQGKVGHLSGQISKGRNVLTLKPDMSKVTKTSIQVVNNDKFNVLRKLYLQSNETINKIVCANNSFKEAGYNFFSRKNYNNLSFDNINAVDSIYVGNSSLPRVQVLTAKYNSAHTLMTVTYNTSTFGVYGSNSQVYCCLYDASNILLYCLKSNYDFFSGTFVIDLPNNELIDYNNLYISVIASSNTDSKKFSTTLNNWILSTISVSSFNVLQNPINMFYDSAIIKCSEGVQFEGLQFMNVGTFTRSNVNVQKLSNGNVYVWCGQFNLTIDASVAVTVFASTGNKICNILKHKAFDSSSLYALTARPVARYTRQSALNRSAALVHSLSLFGSSVVGASSDSSWLQCSYTSTNVFYNVEANNTGVERVGKIIINLSLFPFSLPIWVFQVYE